jgi:hypothetical protein
MTKVLRKYNKWLLGIGGSLLMVTFLLTGPQSIFQPDPGKRVVATMGGAAVRAKDKQHADLELEALKSFAPAVVTFMMHIDNGDHWMLLAKEAEEAGLVGAEGDGERWIPELGDTTAQLIARQEVMKNMAGVPPEFLGQLRGFIDGQIRQKAAAYKDQVIASMQSGRPIHAARNRLSQSQFDMALAKLHGVTRLMEQYQSAARISDRRAVSEVKRDFDRVLVDAVVVPASKALEGIPEPTEAQIAEQYLKYKDAKPGTGEFGFGYLQPARVKLEWMMLDRDAIAKTITIDAVDANKHWRQNKDKYKGEFAADRAKVEDDLRNAKVDQILQDADRFYKTHLRGATRTLAQDGPVKKVPADWDSKRPKMADLAAELDKSLKAQNPALPAPTTDARATEWVKIGLAANIPGVGGSAYKIGTKQGKLSDLLGELYELNPAATIGLQEKVPFETALTDGKGNSYYINVLEHHAESAPDSIEEVKAEVVKDLKLMAAFEKLKSQQAEFQLTAVKDGLDPIAKLYATPAAPGAADQTPTPLPVMKLAGVQRERAEGPLNAEPVREAVMGAADALGQLFKATPENVVQRTLSVPIPSQLSLGVIQIQGQEPATVELMRTTNKTFFDRAAGDELMSVSTEGPFSFDVLKRRYNYKLVSAEETKSASGEPSAPRPLEMP